MNQFIPLFFALLQVICASILHSAKRLYAKYRVPFWRQVFEKVWHLSGSRNLIQHSSTKCLPFYNNIQFKDERITLFMNCVMSVKYIYYFLCKRVWKFIVKQDLPEEQCLKSSEVLLLGNKISSPTSFNPTGYVKLVIALW